MIICSCNALSDHDVHRVLSNSTAENLSPEEIHPCLGCQLKCGRCVETIQQILDTSSQRNCADCWAGKSASRVCVNALVSVDSTTAITGIRMFETSYQMETA